MSKSGWFEVRAGTAFHRGGAAQDDALDVGGPSAEGGAEGAGEHVADGVGEVDVVVGGQVEDVLRLHAFGDEEEGHVTDDFAGRGDFDDVAEELVDAAVHLFDFLPAVGEAHGVGLLAEVAVLAAGDFMDVEGSAADAGAGVEGAVVASDGFPVAE